MYLPPDIPVDQKWFFYDKNEEILFSEKPFYSENDDGNNYSFYGLQAGYSVNNQLGAGNYRIVIAGASEDFLDPTGSQLESRAGTLLSFDQEFSESIGGWIRFGWQTDDAAVDYNAIYSGGVDFKGSSWGRQDDNIGIGYAFDAADYYSHYWAQNFGAD